MDELGYFAANDPARVDRRTTGRLIAAGTILALCGAAVGLLCAVGAGELLRPNARMQDRLQVAPVLAAFVACTAFLLTTGLGTLMRLRWSRPVALVGMAVWRSYGWVIFGISVLGTGIQIYRNGFDFFSWSSFVDYWIVSYGLFWIIAVGVPWLVIRLLQPDRVQETLNLYDVHARWTDGLSRQRAVTTANLAIVAAFTLWLAITWPNSYWWQHDAPLQTAFGVTATLFLTTAVLVATGRQTARRIATALLLLCFAFFVYAAHAGGSKHYFRYSDSAACLCTLISLDALCVLQIRRLGTGDAASLRATRPLS